MKEKGLAILRRKPMIDIMLMSILSIVCIFLPYASYTYKSTKYTLSGLELMLGKTILGGQIQINPQILLILAVILNILIITLIFAFSKLKPRTGGILLLLLGLTAVVCNIAMAVRLSGMLREARNVSILFGSFIPVILGVVIVIRALYLMYRLKVINMLDFMVIPGLLYLIINNYLPMVGIVLAFKKIDYNIGIWTSPWVGFDNFIYLFKTSAAWIITRNTLLYNLAFIIVGNILGIIVGIFLSEVFSKKLRKFYQTSILLPQLISYVIVAYIVFGFLSNESGWITQTLLGGTDINFYQEKSYWPFILILVNTWKGLGYSAVIYLSSVVGIDRTLIEAAYVDGAGRMKQIKNIILPLLKPTIVTLILLQVGRIFYSDFGLFFQVPMDSGALYDVTNVIDTYVYRSLMKMNNISMASAASAYQSVVGFVIVVTVNAVVRKIDKENALF